MLIQKVSTIAIYFLIYIVLQLFLGVGWVNYYDRPTQLITAAAWGFVCVQPKKEIKNEVSKHI